MNELEKLNNLKAKIESLKEMHAADIEKTEDSFIKGTLKARISSLDLVLDMIAKEMGSNE